MSSYLNKRVVKDGGSFQHTGIVVSEFKTTQGADRLVLEFDTPVEGMLHIYRPDQVRVLEWHEERALWLEGLIHERVNPEPAGQ